MYVCFFLNLITLIRKGLTPSPSPVRKILLRACLHSCCVIEMRDAMSPLLELAEVRLWRWKTFPIILPDPLTQQTDSGSSRVLMLEGTHEGFTEKNKYL